MFNRLLFSFLLIVSCTSCKDSLSLKKKSTPVLDTLVDFTKVDVSPSFKLCDKLIDEAKTNCFRLNIHQQLTKYLKGVTLTFIEEVITIEVVLSIDNKGVVGFKSIKFPTSFGDQKQVFEEEIINAIAQLPKLSPAIKRGIPVATEYILPIVITPKN